MRDVIVSQSKLLKSPHLTTFDLKLTDYECYLWDLIPKLRDPEWVAALRECPGCKKLIMSSAKWENKFCTPRCKKKNWARVNRKPIDCPAYGKISLLECRRFEREENLEECQNCPNSKKYRLTEMEQRWEKIGREGFVIGKTKALSSERRRSRNVGDRSSKQND